MYFIPFYQQNELLFEIRNFVYLLAYTVGHCITLTYVTMAEVWRDSEVDENMFKQMQICAMDECTHRIESSAGHGDFRVVIYCCKSHKKVFLLGFLTGIRFHGIVLQEFCFETG